MVTIGDRESLNSILEINEQLKNKQDSNGNTALHLAAKGWNASCLNSLVLFFDADLTIQNNDGESPLYCAAKCGSSTIFSNILKDYSRFDLKFHNTSLRSKDTLLVLAWRFLDIEFFRFLLEHGGDVNDIDSLVRNLFFSSLSSSYFFM